MTHRLIRCETSAQVEAIAAANADARRFTHTAYAASVELGGVVYFWAAA